MINVTCAQKSEKFLALSLDIHLREIKPAFIEAALLFVAAFDL